MAVIYSISGFFRSLSKKGRYPLISDAAPSTLSKWCNLSLLSLSELLAMGVWFSASAVLPQLDVEWGLSDSQRSWMTMSVQLGFVVGALLSAFTNLADRLSPRALIAISTAAAALFNALIPWLDAGATLTIVLRFLTGMCLAGVYPPGMKLVATWAKGDRGLGIGLLVGALAVGSAMPHLLNAVPPFGEGGMPPWRTVLYAASAMAALGAVIAASFVKDGPYLVKTGRFDWRFAGTVVSDRPVRLANFGYLGHMWELYSMWAWVPIFILASYDAAGWNPVHARLAGFTVIAIGGLGSLLAGALADRIGRTTVTIASLLISGGCAMVAGLLFDHPGWLTVLVLVWGFAVVADSAQFSTAVSELTDPRYVGTALTMQTSLGFLLTMITIHIVPPLVATLGWQKVFMILALGPLFGIISMTILRRLPDATKMASGNR